MLPHGPGGRGLAQPAHSDFEPQLIVELRVPEREADFAIKVYEWAPSIRECVQLGPLQIGLTPLMLAKMLREQEVGSRGRATSSPCRECLDEGIRRHKPILDTRHTIKLEWREAESPCPGGILHLVPIKHSRRTIKLHWDSTTCSPRNFQELSLKATMSSPNQMMAFRQPGEFQSAGDEVVDRPANRNGNVGPIGQPVVARSRLLAMLNIPEDQEQREPDAFPIMR